MSAKSDRTRPSAVPDAVPDAGQDPVAATPPAPSLEKPRWFSLRDGSRAKKFALSLKSNARWTKGFLHGGK